MNTSVPDSIQDFANQYPEVWQAFAQLGEVCHTKGGPLDEKTRRLVKLGIAISAQQEGAVHSATRQAIDGGATRDDLFHVAILAITTIGWPRAYAAMTWIRDVVDRPREAA